jgi:biotin operon repressor
MTSRASQRERILELLSAARGNWVSLPKITECAAQYNARIFELRRLGYRITNRTREVDGERHSWFRLESPPADVHPQESENLMVANQSSFREFGNLAPESYGVD